MAEIANHVPQVVVEWSRCHSKLTSEEVVRKLWDGDPRIAILAEGQHGLRIMVWTFRGDERRRRRPAVVRSSKPKGRG